MNIPANPRHLVHPHVKKTLKLYEFVSSYSRFFPVKTGYPGLGESSASLRPVYGQYRKRGTLSDILARVVRDDAEELVRRCYNMSVYSGLEALLFLLGLAPTEEETQRKDLKEGDPSLRASHSLNGDARDAQVVGWGPEIGVTKYLLKKLRIPHFLPDLRQLSSSCG